MNLSVARKPSDARPEMKISAYGTGADEALHPIGLDGTNAKVPSASVVIVVACHRS